ncbi:MAG: acetate--CoA ligase family protein [Thermoplasmata archaeon]|nr:acetate--CoA ligase family protein [Thermoplasmata archaeon]
MTEFEVKEILKEYDIPTTHFTIITNESELKTLNIPYPLVIKISTSEITHKTDVGGVKLDLHSDEELVDAYNELQQKFPNGDILVEPMEEKGIEVIIGLINDPTFGLSIMFGLGGIFTEVLKDVTFRVLPIDRTEAELMLSELKGKKLLEGFRGIKISKEAIIDIILKTAKLGEDFQDRIDQMDLNPVFIRENDAIVVDAKMVLK